MAYRLRENVHFCIADDRTVFLDVLADRYFCLPFHCDMAFQALLHGEEIGGAAREALSPLTHAGILLPDISAPPLQVTTAGIRPALDARPRIDRPPTFSGIIQAIICQLLASRRLKRKSLADIIAGIRIEQARSSAEPPAGIEQAISELVSAFSATAVFFRTADLCLARALAFSMACHRRRITPTIVFGVQLNPFRAHCWVQREDRIILDDLGQAPLFTPIMVV